MGGQAEAASTMRRYDVIRALGIEVVPSRTLSTNAAMVDGEAIALVRPDLRESEHDEALDWLLIEALQASWSASRDGTS